MRGLSENLEKLHPRDNSVCGAVKKIFLFEQIYFANIVAW